MILALFLYRCHVPNGIIIIPNTNPLTYLPLLTNAKSKRVTPNQAWKTLFITTRWWLIFKYHFCFYIILYYSIFYVIILHFVSINSLSLSLPLFSYILAKWDVPWTSLKWILSYFVKKIIGGKWKSHINLN